MANPAGRIGDFVEEIEQAAGEVVEDVRDQVGEAIEQGVQSITGKQLTPQQIQQQQEEDQKQLMEARKKVKWHQDVQLAQLKVREEEKQKQVQRKQQEQEEEQQRRLAKENEKRRTIVSPAKQAPQIPGQPPAKMEEEVARSRQEIGKGHGIGG